MAEIEAPPTVTARTPPHSLEAEQAVLGGLMLNNRAYYEVADQITADDFYRHQHQLIYRAINWLAECSEPLDAVTVAQGLREREELENAGGIVYLAELAERTPTADNIAAYAKIVRERSILRRLIAASQTIAGAAFSPSGRQVDGLLDLAEREIFAIQEERLRDGGPQPVLELLTAAVQKVEQLYENKETVTGLPTGFRDLDEKTAGLQDGELIIVAGRPSMGKSSLALNMAEAALMDEADGAVVVFSLEMPAESMVMRLLSSLGRLDQTRLRTGALEDDDWPRLTSAVNLLSDKSLFIDDTPGLSPTEIRTRTRRIALETKRDIKLIVVDYLQLMRGSGPFENRVNEISEISRSLKAIAKELKCPVMALSQLNRSLEQRPNKRPLMSDLRESGAIEQDADVILFIYRDEVYDPESPERGIAELIIGKQRNGPLGTVKTAFIGHYTKFENLAPDYYNDQEYE